MNVPPAAPVCTTNLPNLDMIQQGLAAANSHMESIANYQVMSAAPSPIKNQYIQDVFATIQMQASNKQQKAKLEKQQLQIAQEKAALELLQLEKKKLSTASFP